MPPSAALMAADAIFSMSGVILPIALLTDREMSEKLFMIVPPSESNTNVGMMGETFKYVAPVAGALGYSVEDAAVAIGLMANSGIKSSQAGTALRQTLTRLASRIEENLGHKCGEMTAGAIVFSKEYGLLCQTTQAQTLLQQIREG